MDARTLSREELDLFRSLIHEKTGISLGESKRELLVARLGRRLRAHGLDSFGDYYVLLQRADADGSELRAMINCVTTNKTSFYREAHHFEMLERDVLPRLVAETIGPIRIWSAGCSTGEEPYSIAMSCLNALGVAGAERVRILATDIDTDVLDRARAGVYPAESFADVDPSRWKRWFQPERGTERTRMRASEAVRARVAFRPLNLIETPWPLRAQFDVVFCRNVMIYFDRDTQRDLVARFAERLAPRGRLFVGHTENLQWLSDAFEPLEKTAYRLRDDVPRPPSAPTAPEAQAPRAPLPSPSAARPLERARIVVGGVHASSVPCEVRTVLGSCVSACLFDPVAGVGGMNHFLLAEGSDSVLPFRYGVHAMEMLINQIMRLGGERHRLQAKAFGGADVLEVLETGSRIGKRNAEFITSFLAAEKIPLVARRLGGGSPVEVRFETHTGRSFVRVVGGGHAAHALHQEERYRLEVQHPTARHAGDEITLF